MRVRILIIIITTLVVGCIYGEHKSVQTVQKTVGKFSDEIVTFRYFTDKILDSTHLIVKGHLLERVTYFPNGETSKYEFYDIGGNLCLKREFSESGSIVKSEGVPCFYGATKRYLESAGEKLVLTDIDTFVILFFAPTIPSCSTQFYINTKGGLLPNVFKMEDVNAGYYTIKDHFNAGVWELCFSMIFIDSFYTDTVRKDKCDILEVVHSE